MTKPWGDGSGESLNIAVSTGKVTLSSVKNSTVKSRSLVLTLRTKHLPVKSCTITVTQEPGEATLSITPMTLNFGQRSSTKTVSVESNDSWSI